MNEDKEGSPVWFPCSSSHQDVLVVGARMLSWWAGRESRRHVFSVCVGRET